MNLLLFDRDLFLLRQVIFSTVILQNWKCFDLILEAFERERPSSANDQVIQEKL